jgi:hypothetical protein
MHILIYTFGSQLFLEPAEHGQHSVHYSAYTLSSSIAYSTLQYCEFTTCCPIYLFSSHKKRNAKWKAATTTVSYSPVAQSVQGWREKRRQTFYLGKLPRLVCLCIYLPRLFRRQRSFRTKGHERVISCLRALCSWCPQYQHFATILWGCGGKSILCFVHTLMSQQQPK